MKVTNTHISIMKNVLSKLKTNKVSYICFALDQIKNNENPELKTEVEELQRYVIKQIFPNFSYGGWLSKNYPKFCEDMEGDFQEGRIQWVKNMIKVLKAEL